VDDLFAPTEFESGSDQYDKSKSESNGRIFTLTRDTNRDLRVDFKDIEWKYLVGDGDFRSSELMNLRDEADIIVTNPPFSLFATFLTWILDGKKKFIIIGPTNAISYKETFSAIMEDKVWLGNGFHAGNAYFASPNNVQYASGVYDPRTGLVKFRNVSWYTNMEHGRRHQPLLLMTTADNTKFSKRSKVKDIGYKTYDNYKAIEVPFTEAIPSDFVGVMGVPISFLDKYNPEQFEILGASGNGFVPDELIVPGQSKYDRPYLDGQRMYVRLFIRHRKIHGK
jgi:hypothetical protein